MKKIVFVLCLAVAALASAGCTPALTGTAFDENALAAYNTPELRQFCAERAPKAATFNAVMDGEATITAAAGGVASYSLGLPTRIVGAFLPLAIRNNPVTGELSQKCAIQSQLDGVEPPGG